MIRSVCLLAIAMIWFVPTTLEARTILVDQNGSADHSTITGGIAAAADGDTVKVLPGIYYEQVVVGRNIVLMGSGYEGTRISSSVGPAVKLNSGALMWFGVTCPDGAGVHVGHAFVRDCVTWGCGQHGIYIEQEDAKVANCVIYNNGSYGISTPGEKGTVYNCVSWANGDCGFHRVKNLTYCNGSRRYTGSNIGCIEADPGFADPDDPDDPDFHIGSSSPCWDAGNPSIFDPDGSRSDMGYFGGPDCPIYPVITSVYLDLLPTGEVRVRATAKANY